MESKLIRIIKANKELVKIIMLKFSLYILNAVIFILDWSKNIY